MSIPKKGSCNIVVNGVNYRWRVRKKPTYSQGLEWNGLTLAVEHATYKGCVLVVELPQSHPSNWLGSEAIPVLPSIVASLVRAALQSGWKPAQMGSPFLLSADKGVGSE